MPSGPINPNDPQYMEFHHGQNEFWPIDDPLKSKSSGKFPAALVSGLELVAAAAAAGLLAVSLSGLYVSSSARLILENTAHIHTSVFNNHSDQDVRYNLVPEDTPEQVLQEGTLEDDRDLLKLENLRGGTDYLLLYFDGEQNKVGQFWFTTPGDAEEPAEPQPDPGIGGGEEIPAETTPAGGETQPEETVPAETVPEETVPEETVPETEPDTPVYIPQPEPGIGGGDDDEEPVTPPDDTPSDPGSDQPVGPQLPSAETPTTSDSIYVGFGDSGYTEEDFFAFTDDFIFRNIPERAVVVATRNGEEVTPMTPSLSSDGTLTVSVGDNMVRPGETTTTTVTVYASTGEKLTEQTSTVTAPMLEETWMEVTPNGDGSYTYTLKATVTEGATMDMTITASLYPTSTVLPIELTLPAPGYEATYTSGVLTLEAEDFALAYFTARWDVPGAEHCQITSYAEYSFTP